MARSIRLSATVRQQLVTLHHHLQTIRPSTSRCRSLGLYDVDDVRAEYYGYCVTRFIDHPDQPMTPRKLESIAHWFPGNYRRRMLRERERLRSTGRLPAPGLFQGRMRTPLERRSS